VNGVEYILDSTALLAFLFRETGYEQIGSLLSRSAICSINVTEVAHKLIHRGALPHEAEGIIRDLKLEVSDWTEIMAYRSGQFASFGVSHGLSLGDRACLTLASHLRATAVTSDRQWRHVHGLGVKLLIFR